MAVVERNINYQQQYSNQHQEQYQEHQGGGRGRESGGVGRGRGQQTHRTPAYPRQNADRFDGGSTWSRVASGQQIRAPSHAQTLTQTQNRPEHSKDDDANAYVPIRRPDRGTLASRQVKLLVNHFPVKFDPSNSILRYDVEVKQEYGQDESSSTRPLKKSIPKSSLRQIQENLCFDYPDKFPLLQTAYNGEKNIFSAISLQPGTYTVQLSGRSYLCTIKYGNELNLSKLQDFLIGNALQIPRDVLQALDVVMKAILFREKVSVGRGIYPRVHRKEDDLRCGVAAYRGSQQSLKVTSNGLVMCTDYSVMPFRKRIPVLDFLKEHVREIQVVDDVPRFRNKVMLALKGLMVSVTHRRTNQKYTVSGLTDKHTKDISFEKEDLEGKKEPDVVMLTDYFRDKWDKEIMHKGIPCLKLGNGKKPNYVPMEFCVLAVIEDGKMGASGNMSKRMVLNKEMVDMKKALYTKHYRPLVTFVVAQKRHTTRLFFNIEVDSGNVPPGTVVDTNIVHPSNFDFYLCSHFGGIGTSKLTHYSLIWDENRFSSDEMQKLIYDLCYIFARCTKPVSLVPPVYYADLVAYRGRMFQEVVMEMEASGSGSVSSFDQYFYNLDQHLKDSMFFI
ncbi:hypothetical protein L1987_57301 [Smallanthus sonchifolius]|uniref:Uncharacterized protein n=1 Tax=Smallanthus sonchifolius TaxID=185202 RepID=A0ACB9DC85_9ASTR|nr:hypothetical protein L1987_57301 [Smallanthus sonchifolius]